MLKWEAIVNDPIGALLGVGIYAYITHGGAQANSTALITAVVAASVLAGLIGGGTAFALTAAFVRGWVPEYLKAPELGRPPCRERVCKSVWFSVVGVP